VSSEASPQIRSSEREASERCERAGVTVVRICPDYVILLMYSETAL
jgi:hypothetical protein